MEGFQSILYFIGIMRYFVGLCTHCASQKKKILRVPLFKYYYFSMREEWRLIESGRCGAAFNMALDEAIATSVRTKGAPPALRLYGWSTRSLSIGCFQKASEIDRAYCAAKGIPIVRRPTGGRAILHDAELTYSFSAGTDCGPFSHGLLDSYKRISDAFGLAFAKIGIHAETRKTRERGSVLTGSPLCFQSSSFAEVLIDGRKIVGSAQKRWSDGMLQQGSIPYFWDEREILRIFGIQGQASLKNRTTGLKEVVPDLDETEFKGIVAASFEETFAIRFVLTQPSREEMSLARDLQERKYLQPFPDSRP
jgi:lipoate-protein ligase A